MIPDDYAVSTVNYAQVGMQWQEYNVERVPTLLELRVWDQGIREYTDTFYLRL